MISIRENNVSQLINNWHTVADELLPASGEECERDGLHGVKPAGGDLDTF